MSFALFFDSAASLAKTMLHPVNYQKIAARFRRL
jgi:hypothetical protein